MSNTERRYSRKYTERSGRTQTYYYSHPRVRRLKLSNEEIEDILIRANNGEKIKDISTDLNVSEKTISRYLLKYLRDNIDSYYYIVNNG